MKFNKHANVIYADSAEKHVMGVILYPNEDSGKLFWDEKFEFPVMTNELEDLFVKGLINIKTENGISKPLTLTAYSNGNVNVNDSNGEHAGTKPEVEE